MPMQHDFCFGKRRDKAAHRGAIPSESRVGPPQNFVNIKSVGIDESLLQEFPGHTETNKTQVCWRRKGCMCEFVNIKCEPSSNVAVRALVIGHRVAVLIP